MPTLEIQTVRENIISDTELRSFVDELLELPKRLQEARHSVDVASATLESMTAEDEINAAISMMQDEEYFEVRDKKNEDGKPKYTNEQQRQAAVNINLNKRQDYIDAVARLMQARKEKGTLKMNSGKAHNTLKYLIDRYYVLKSVLDVTSGLCNESATVGDLAGLCRYRANNQNHETINSDSITRG